MTFYIHPGRHTWGANVVTILFRVSILKSVEFSFEGESVILQYENMAQHGGDNVWKRVDRHQPYGKFFKITLTSKEITAMYLQDENGIFNTIKNKHSRAVLIRNEIT